MKKWYILLIILMPIFLFSQKKYYFANIGKSILKEFGNNFDGYDNITSFKIGFGREYIKSKYGFSYNFYFSSIGGYDNFVDTTARLPYIGVNPSFIFKLNKFRVNTGLYFAYCLNRKSPSNYPEAYYYYKKTDFGISLQPEYILFNLKEHQITITSEIFGSLLPIYTTDLGPRPITINETTRNFSFSLGLKFIMGK